MFDVAYGTSVGGFNNSVLACAPTDMGTGGLIVLLLFLRQLPVLECVNPDGRERSCQSCSEIKYKEYDATNHVAV